MNRDSSTRLSLLFSVRISMTIPNPVHQQPEVSVIETERLRLRGPRPEDFPHSAALWSDPAVTRYTTGKPLSEEEVWGRLLRYVGHWAWMGFGFWVVEEKSTGRFAGEVGFSDWKREVEPTLQGLPELGWVLASRVHGQGYATEAARAAIRWADAHFGKHLPSPRYAGTASPATPQLSSARMTCIIHPENARSIRVAEKCGFQEVLRTSYRGDPIILFVQ